ncbi:MAG: hypothetical protein JKX92_06105 [Porticoccaceae bacterium]|nr:hypothetical protein [Porticoccaceae bacterium]
MATNNYVRGSGRLYFDQFVDGTTIKQGRRYLGHTPSLSNAVETETLDHINNDGGSGETDATDTLSTTRSGAFSTDNMAPENVAMFYLGSSDLFTQAATPVVDEALTVKQGRSYQLGAAQGSGMGVRNVTAVDVQDDTDTTTYVAGTDYVLDPVMGTLYINTTAEGGSIADDDVLHVDYTPAAETRTQIISGTSSAKGELFFESTNPTGDKVDYLYPSVELSPDGDHELKSDEWQVMGFKIGINKLNDSTEAIIAQGRA